MGTDTKESLRIFLTQQLRDVEEDIETINSYISCNPPETSGELLKLRELQRKYREIAASIKNEIVKLDSVKILPMPSRHEEPLPAPLVLSQVKKLSATLLNNEKLNTGFVNNGFDRAMEGREERTGGTSR
jgi:hypothetical protein